MNEIEQNHRLAVFARWAEECRAMPASITSQDHAYDAKVTTVGPELYGRKSLSQVISELGIDTHSICITMIGGAKLSNAPIFIDYEDKDKQRRAAEDMEVIMDYFISHTIEGLYLGLRKDHRQKLAIALGGTDGGVLGMVSNARNLIEQLHGITPTIIGVVPRDAVVHIAREHDQQGEKRASHRRIIDAYHSFVAAILQKMGSNQEANDIEDIVPKSPQDDTVTPLRFFIEKYLADFLGIGKQDVDLESPHPSHIIEVENAYPNEGIDGAWRTMSDMICELGMAFNSHNTGVTVVLNGGKGTAYELSQKLKQRGRVVVVNGSGRFADGLATWLRDGDTPLSAEQQACIHILTRDPGDKTAEYRDRLREIEIFDLDAYDHPQQAVDAFVGLLLRYYSSEE